MPKLAIIAVVPSSVSLFSRSRAVLEVDFTDLLPDTHYGCVECRLGLLSLVGRLITFVSTAGQNLATKLFTKLILTALSNKIKSLSPHF